MSAGEYQSILDLALASLIQASAVGDEEPADLLALDQAIERPWPTGALPFAAGAMACWVKIHLGLDESAARTAIAAEPLWRASGHSPPLLAFTFTLCFALTRSLHAASAEERPAWEEKLAAHYERLSGWSQSCPETFLHMRLLVDAERARLDGNVEEAERLYDEAIEDAQANGFVNGEALGLRLAGELALARRKKRFAKAYWLDACEAYTRWGAKAAAARIRTNYPEFFPVSPRSASASEEAQDYVTTTSTTTTGGGAMNSRLDAASMLRAAQALTSDMVLDSLLGRMLRLLAQNAGASRAVLSLVHQGGALRVEAELVVEPERLSLGLREPVDDSPRLPGTLVRYVERSGEPVVLGQAIRDTRFDEDPYLRARRPASVLAVPLSHQGRLSGVMYLEHPNAADAFPMARLEMVTLLAAQAASAVENAQLYAEVQASNARLEQQVEERTAELKAAKEAADAANRAKSDFLASMSHELRTPLNGILGYAQILVRSPTMVPKDKDGVTVIQRSGEHLLTLINDVLDLAKIEAGKMELYQRDIDFALLVETVCDLSRVRAQQKGITFSYEASGPELHRVRVDEKRLLQVLLNVLGNAIKFTERGGVTLRVAVQSESSRGQGSQVRFQIADTGPGIEQAHIERIFLPFEQVGSHKARAEGTGLGLSICNRILALMGGTLTVQSQLGQGSVFEVTLRLAEGASAESNDAPEAGAIVGYEGSRKRLLVVDDREDNRAVLRDLLLPLGFEVAEAASGEEALAVAATEKPSLILLDLAMPGMSGYETARRIRSAPELSQSTILIASSASLAENERRASAEAGCRDFLPKPIQAERLFEMLRVELGLQWIREEPRAAEEEEPLFAPSIEELRSLLALASRGRVRELSARVDHLAEGDARLAAWVGQLRAMVQRYQMKQVREFLQVHTERRLAALDQGSPPR